MNYSAPELLSSTRFLVSWPQHRRMASGPNLVPVRHAEPLVISSSWWEMRVKFARPDTSSYPLIGSRYSCSSSAEIANWAKQEVKGTDSPSGESVSKASGMLHPSTRGGKLRHI